MFQHRVLFSKDTINKKYSLSCELFYFEHTLVARRSSVGDSGIRSLIGSILISG